MKFLVSTLLVLFFCTLAFSQKIVEHQESFKVEQANFRLVLDVDAGRVSISRGNDRHTCKVFVSYPEEKTSVDLRYSEKRNQLRIDVDVEEIDLKKNDEKNIPVDLLVELPTRAEIDFDAKIKAGEVDIFLGDLYISDFSLTVWAGDTQVEFDRPNNMEMETFEVDAKIGETSLINLGNANFSEGEINGGIGEMTIDFLGRNPNKSTARIDLDIGETTVILPRELGVKMRVSKFLFLSDVSYPNWFDKEGNYYFSQNYEKADKTLYLSISPGIGALNIEVE